MVHCCTRATISIQGQLIPYTVHNTWLQSFTKQLGLHKLLEEDFPRVDVVSAPPVDTLPAFESREYCLFFQDFDALLIYLAIIFLHSNLVGWLITHFSVV